MHIAGGEVHFTDSRLASGLTQDDIAATLMEAMVKRGYDEGRLSMGEVAEIMGVSYIEAHEWMNAQGVPTLRRLPPDLAEASRRNAAAAFADAPPAK